MEQFDQATPLVTVKQNRVGKYIKTQHFRNWFKVTKEELTDVKVCELHDENGKYFISNTSWYVPEWLRDLEHTEHDDLPEDSLVVHGVENDPEMSHAK